MPKKLDMVRFVEPLLRLGLYVVRPLIGMGFWFRQEGEIALVFTRGKPKRVDAGVRQVVFGPRREHSRKPDECRPRIERLVAGPYLELFGRTDRPQWTFWGDDVGRFEDEAA